MKKKIFVTATILAIIILGITAWFYGYHNRKNMDNIPSKEIMVTYLQEKSEQYATEQLIGYSQDSLRYIWGEPDIMLSGLWGDGWNIDDNTGILVFYDTDNKVEHVQLGKKEVTPDETNESEQIKTTIVYPLPTTIDLNNIKDCTLAVSIENGDIYTDKADTTNLKMKVKIYDYELFDLVDVSMLEVGSILEINKKQVEITSIERNESGTVIINGGIDVGGYDLVTNENGVFYSIGYSDMKTYYEIGEAELELSPEFVYIDASDLDNGEKKYTAADFTADDIFFDSKGTPHNTTIVVENGIVTSMTKIYTP